MSPACGWQWDTVRWNKIFDECPAGQTCDAPTQDGWFLNQTTYTFCHA